jgi:hypothetical protein
MFVTLKSAPQTSHRGNATLYNTLLFTSKRKSSAITRFVVDNILIKVWFVRNIIGISIVGKYLVAAFKNTNGTK